MTRCLITGASGFVGSNLARRLCEEGWEVRCLVRNTSRLDQLEPLPVERTEGSLADAESLQRAVTGVDYVFHAAGRTVAFQGSQFFDDNVGGTRRLAEACLTQLTPPTFLMVSSLAAGGTGTMQLPRTEELAERPVSTYGKSKLAAEQALAELADDLPASVVRPPMVFGRADRASLALYRSLRFLPLHLSPGLRRFPVSLVHVTDLCDAMVRIAVSGERLAPPASGSNGTATRSSQGQGKYYVAADRHVTYGEMGQLAARAAGWTVATLPLPTPIFWIAGAIGETVGRARGRATLINFDKVREATARGWVCSDAKIRSMLGYRPASTLEDDFAATVAWYREHGWI
ncbi:MAG: NAD-dependent epimerase/dehydratase family protein [Planctomycetaceae bacterium]|nr:NAD-dependent epimerase/dehydratase family protein [Planctomycetaceae bacterium]